MSLADHFMDLFAGREDAVGTEEGGALRRPDDAMAWWWATQIKKHLDGTAPCGVYPLVPTPWMSDETPTWLVKWGCVDFDEGEQESFIHAQNVRLALESMGVTAWVERSRSKGYHVWVFLQNWMAARLIREALLGACQVVDAPTKEINPKSTGFDDPATLGNYVRLPYPGWLAPYGETFPWPRDRRVMVTPDGYPIALAAFMSKARQTLASVDDMKRVAGLYEPPRRVIPHVRPVAGRLEGDIYKRMGGLAWTIFQEGPREGLGRGHTLYKLACLLVEGGAHTHDEIFQLCWEADQAWGKFHLRPNGESQVLRVVERAYGA